jgi:hypothetical protein
MNVSRVVGLVLCAGLGVMACEDRTVSPDTVSPNTVAAAQAPTAAAGAAAAPEVAKPRVMLFADMGKQESACGCGQVIRLVQMTGEQGIDVELVDKRSQKDVFERYDVQADPVVIFFGADGKEAERFVGEAPETIDSVRARLREMAANAN